MVHGDAVVGASNAEAAVGAVYDREYFVEFRKKRAVIDRAYRDYSDSLPINL